MNTTVTLSSQGQITIPAKFRELLGLKPLDTLSIYIDSATQKLEIARQETLEESINRINANLSPETKAAIKKNAGKTVRELRTEWDTSPEGQKYYQEKYFNAN